MALSTISGTTGITDATITSAKLADFAAAVDLNGVELILDADADTSITADTDDRIDFKLGGVEHISINNSSGDTVIKPMVDGKDIVFQQYDGNKILEINDGNYVAISGAAAGPGELRFYEDTDLGTNYTGLKAGNATASVSYVLPLADGSDGHALKTDGSGTLSWGAAGSNAVTALNNATQNELVTVGSTTTQLDAESNLTFDGSTLTLTGAATVSTTLGVTGILTGSNTVIGTTFEPTGDTSASDNAAIGYTSGEGLILTGQGSTNDITIKNDADATVISIPTGTTGVTLAGTLGSGAITSTGIVTGTGFTAGSAVLAEAELELLDGLTAGTAIASKVVTTDANIDSTGMRNLTITGTFSDGNYTFDTSGNVSGLGTVGSGAITSSGIVTGTGFTAGSAVLAEAELELLDGLTAGTAIASKVVTTDASIDTTGQRNLTITGELDAATLDISGAIDIAGASVLHAALTQSGGVFTQDGGAVFNEASADVDFRVESNNDANAFFVDGANGNIGFGTSAPSVEFEIADSSSDCEMTIGSWADNVNTKSALNFVKSRTSTIGTGAATATNENIGEILAYGHDTGNTARAATQILFMGDAAPDGDNVAGKMLFKTNNNAGLQTALTIDDGQNAIFAGGNQRFTSGVGINESSPAANQLHITSGDVGTIPTLRVDFDEVCIENSTCGITFMSTTSGGGGLSFGDTDDADAGYYFYYHAQNQVWIGVNGATHFQINSNGDLLATDTTIGSISDERVKENISDLTYDVSKFKQLRPRTFDWKNPLGHDGRSGNKGFVAQEIEAIDDYWVREELVQPDHADFSLLDSVPRSNAVLENGRIIAHGITESAWETGKSNNTYPSDSTWAASAEDARLTKVSTLGKKDAMYISVINQLITRIEALEA